MSSTRERALTEQERETLVGRSFPGGRFVIEPHRQWLLNDVVLGKPGPLPSDGELAHPLFLYLATGAMGMSWDQIFAACGSKADDGPMFGEHSSELIAPLRVGAAYTVTGGFTSVIHKKGRRAGSFDIVEYRLDVHDADDALVATTTNSIVFPRSEA